MLGLDLPRHVYVHIAGIDVVRVSANDFYVLEDNARAVRRLLHAGEPGDDDEAVPRAVRAAQGGAGQPLSGNAAAHLRSVAPPGIIDPTVVVMTPATTTAPTSSTPSCRCRWASNWSRAGPVRRGRHGLHAHHQRPRRVDVIYRRIDDDFIDPLAFDAGSLLGVPGLLSVVRNGRVSLANAIGTGVADDKAIYCFVPDMIDFYLGESRSEERAYRCAVADDLGYVIDHLEELVVGEVGGSGGYGMLVGPMSTTEQRHDFRSKLLSDPITSSPSRPSTVNRADPGRRPDRAARRPGPTC